ncbi:hypothetical protein BHE74_00057052 [Ensete ventricosum]|nr:hypothetical protein BHE74_00057052 [Ensete ventricosum]
MKAPLLSFALGARTARVIVSRGQPYPYSSCLSPTSLISYRAREPQTVGATTSLRWPPPRRSASSTSSQTQAQAQTQILPPVAVSHSSNHRRDATSAPPNTCSRSPHPSLPPPGSVWFEGCARGGWGVGDLGRADLRVGPPGGDGRPLRVHALGGIFGVAMAAGPDHPERDQRAQEAGGARCPYARSRWGRRRTSAATADSISDRSEDSAAHRVVLVRYQERKALVKGSYRERHFNAGSILLGFGVLEAVGGCLNTWFRTGKLFPGPHLFAGAGITVLWALAAALVPAMQKGNETARNLHIALNGLNVLLFVWQIPTGIDIVFKVFEFTKWP